MASSTQAKKRARSSTPELTEKTTKQPKTNPTMVRKTLPKIKTDVRVASGPASAATDMDVDKTTRDEETYDAASSRAALRDIVVLPDDEEEEMPPKERKGKGSSRRVPEVQVSQSTPVLEAVVERTGDPVRTNITFADPLTTDRPSGSVNPAPAALVQVPASPVLESSLFTAYQTLDDPPSAAREALRQVTLVMEQVKVIHEASQVAYNASTALQANVKKSCDLGAQISVLNKQQISLNLDLELAQKNLQTARDEVTAMERK